MRYHILTRADRFCYLLLLAVAVSFVCVSCDKSPDKKTWISVVPKVDDASVAEAYNAFEVMREKYADTEFKIRWDVSSYPTAESQSQLIEKMVENGFAGILISCIDAEGVREAIDMAVEAGVKVGTFDSDCPESLRSFFIGSDNEAAGILGGTTLKELCEAADRDATGIGLFGGVVGDTSMQERLDGFMTTVAEADTAALLWSGEIAATGKKQVEDFLIENEALPVNGVVFLSSAAVVENPAKIEGVVGVVGIERLDSLCRSNEVDGIMGASAAAVFFDPSAELLDFVKAENIPHCAAIVQDFGGMVTGGIEELMKVMRGETFNETTILDVTVIRNPLSKLP